MNTRTFLVLTLGSLFLSPLSAGSAQTSQEALGVDNLAVMGAPEGTPLSGAELDAHTEELTSLMRCPVCQGLSIADSGTMIALAMKEEVRQFIAAGYSDDQILRYFEASYGEFIRLAPKATGFNLTVWIAPVVALLLGALLVVHRLRSKPAVAAAEEAPVDDLAEYRDRVRQELSS